MSDELNQVVVSAIESQEQSVELMEKLIAVAQPGSVFSEPTKSGDYTVITAAEVSVGMGFGYGIGGGSGTASTEGGVEGDEEAEGQKGEGTGAGGGGGGGGFSMGRPVAVISVGPGGVQVEPIVDPTKIALAFFTTLGSMFFILSKMRKASQG